MIARLKEHYLKILHEGKDRCPAKSEVGQSRKEEENLPPLVTIKCEAVLDPDIDIKTETEIME